MRPAQGASFSGFEGFRNCRDAVFLFSGLTSADAGAAVAYS